MTEQEKQTAFLKDLIAHDESPQAKDIEERIKQTERDHRCILKALHLVVLVALLALGGLCYSAVLLPDFFDSSTPMIVRLQFDLVVGSIIGFVGFFFSWLRYRSRLHRLHEECRCCIRQFFNCRLGQSAPVQFPVVQEPSMEAYETRTNGEDREMIDLPKAS